MGDLYLERHRRHVAPEIAQHRAGLYNLWVHPVSRTTGAFWRAVLVGATVAAPTLVLPDSLSIAPEFTMLLAAVATVFTFCEYNTNFPSMLEFRDAPPFNRLRFGLFFAIVVAMTLIVMHWPDTGRSSGVMLDICGAIGRFLDFPYSPIRLLVLVLPADANAEVVNSVRMAGATTYLIGAAAIILFAVIIRQSDWPIGKGEFNVWTNLPLFDPTIRGDVVDRLYNEARNYITVGILLPFVIPGLLRVASPLVDPMAIADPHVLIWTIYAWAFLPACLIMRGLAVARIAGLIAQKRRRTYAIAETKTTRTA